MKVVIIGGVAGGATAAAPVSYTHLDVYKRQVSSNTRSSSLS